MSTKTREGGGWGARTEKDQSINLSTYEAKMAN